MRRLVAGLLSVSLSHSLSFGSLTRILPILSTYSSFTHSKVEKCAHSRYFSCAIQSRVSLHPPAKCNHTFKRHTSSYADFANDNITENERHYIIEVNQGNEKYQQDKLDEALHHYTRALQYRKNDPSALLNKAAILQSMGKDEQAIKDLNTLITQMEKIEVPDHFRRQTATAYLRIGEYMTKKQNYKEAVKMIRRANELEPASETEDFLKEVMSYARPDVVIVNSYADDEKYFAQLTKGHEVEIKKSLVHGRGLFATKDFEEGELVFAAPSYVTAFVEDLRKNYKPPKNNKNNNNPRPVIEGYCMHCIRPLPAAVIHDWEKYTQDFEFKKKYDLTEQRIKDMHAEIHKFVGLSPEDYIRVKEGEEDFCSEECKNAAKSEYGELMAKKGEFKMLLSVDPSSRDASVLMAKLLAKLDKELPPGTSFVLGNDLKRLSNCPNPEIIPDLERPRYEALKALFPKRELSFDVYLQLRTLLNFNCFGVDTEQFHFTFGVPESDVAAAKTRSFSTPEELNKQMSNTSDHTHDHDHHHEHNHECNHDHDHDHGHQGEGGQEGDGNDVPMISQTASGIEGATLIVLGSYLNHSCDANILMMDSLPHAKDIPFVACAPITKGQELFWCYAGKGMDGETRRRALLLQYKFSCKCARCRLEIGSKITTIARASITAE